MRIKLHKGQMLKANLYQDRRNLQRRILKSMTAMYQWWYVCYILQKTRVRICCHRCCSHPVFTIHGFSIQANNFK